MTGETKNRLNQFFGFYPALKADGVAEIEFDTAIEPVFPKIDRDYKDFVLQFGGAIVGSYPIYGLRSAEVMSKETVIEVTRRYRNQVWRGTEDWLVISEDHSGNPIGLAKDGSIWLSDHDYGSIEKLASSFEGFIEYCLSRLNR